MTNPTYEPSVEDQIQLAVQQERDIWVKYTRHLNTTLLKISQLGTFDCWLGAHKALALSANTLSEKKAKFRATEYYAYGAMVWRIEKYDEKENSWGYFKYSSSNDIEKELKNLENPIVKYAEGYGAP